MTNTVELLLKKYYPLNILKAGELLLQPTDAILIINDLEQIGILILGVDLWYNQGLNLVEDPNSLDLSEICDITQNAYHAREFISHHLPKRTAWVSLVFSEPVGYGASHAPLGHSTVFRMVRGTHHTTLGN
jgi:hypothetical protein